MCIFDSLLDYGVLISVRRFFKWSGLVPKGCCQVDLYSDESMIIF